MTRRSLLHRFARSTMLVLALVSRGNAAADDSCPAALAQATRLVLVVAPDMRSVTAVLRRFERGAPGAAWHEIGKAGPAVVGKAGLGLGVDRRGRREAGGASEA